MWHLHLARVPVVILTHYTNPIETTSHAYTGLNGSKMAGNDVEMRFHFPSICVACMVLYSRLKSVNFNLAK